MRRAFSARLQAREPLPDVSPPVMRRCDAPKLYAECPVFVHNRWRRDQACGGVQFCANCFRPSADICGTASYTALRSWSTSPCRACRVSAIAWPSHRIQATPPADSSPTVTFDGSPPNSRMLVPTQRKAACWSMSHGSGRQVVGFGVRRTAGKGNRTRAGIGAALHLRSPVGGAAHGFLRFGSLARSQLSRK